MALRCGLSASRATSRVITITERNVAAGDRDDVIGPRGLQPPLQIVRQARAIADQDRRDDRRMRIAESGPPYRVTDRSTNLGSGLVPPRAPADEDQRAALDGAGQMKRTPEHLLNRVEAAGIDERLRPPQRDGRFDRPTGGPLLHPRGGHLAGHVGLDTAGRANPCPIVLDVTLDDQADAERGRGGIEHEMPTQNDRPRRAVAAGRRPRRTAPRAVAASPDLGEHAVADARGGECNRACCSGTAGFERHGH